MEIFLAVSDVKRFLPMFVFSTFRGNSKRNGGWRLKGSLVSSLVFYLGETSMQNIPKLQLSIQTSQFSLLVKLGNLFACKFCYYHQISKFKNQVLKLRDWQEDICRRNVLLVNPFGHYNKT